MKKLVVLLLATLVASTAFAQIDPDSDMMGIYFDVGATSNCTDAAPSVPFFAYLCVTNSTAEAINAYELGKSVVGANGAIFMLASNIANGVASGVNVGTELPESGDLIVGLATPLPTAGGVTIVHSWQYLLLAPATLDMFIGASSAPSLPGGLPVVQGTDTGLMTVGTSTGDPSIPVATVNGDCVVAVEDASWGSVKSLYR